MVSDEPLCWTGTSSIERRAQRQAIKARGALASQPAFPAWVGLTPRLLGFLPVHWDLLFICARGSHSLPEVSANVWHCLSALPESELRLTKLAHGPESAYDGAWAWAGG